jgi:hypothetical protein
LDFECVVLDFEEVFVALDVDFFFPELCVVLAGKATASRTTLRITPRNLFVRLNQHLKGKESTHIPWRAKRDRAHHSTFWHSARST